MPAIEELDQTAINLKAYSEGELGIPTSAFELEPGLYQIDFRFDGQDPKVWEACKGHMVMHTVHGMEVGTAKASASELRSMIGDIADELR